MFLKLTSWLNVRNSVFATVQREKHTCVCVCVYIRTCMLYIYIYEYLYSSKVIDGQSYWHCDLSLGLDHLDTETVGLNPA
jgi:hypothetical protein